MAVGRLRQEAQPLTPAVREVQQGAENGVLHYPSRRILQLILGVLWLVDGVLQLFPSMWTSDLVNNIMRPAMDGQPGIIADAIRPFVDFSAQNVILVNAGIAGVQIVLGVLLLAGKHVNKALVASIVWSLVVWGGGEGMGMLLTGQAGAMTGAPGPVLLYGLLAIFAYPRTALRGDERLQRLLLQRCLAGFWGLAVLLQLQPFWWGKGQIAQTISDNQAPGTLSGRALDPSLAWLAHIAGSQQAVFNVCFVVVALLLAVGLASVRGMAVRPFLIGSLALSVLLWWFTQGLGLVLTGSSTDVNSGPLLAACALACWPLVDHRTDTAQVSEDRDEGAVNRSLGIA